MKKVFLDTNIVLDLLAQRDPFYNDAAQLFSLGDRKKADLYVSALTFANTNYILTQSLSPEDTRQILRKLKLLVHVLSLDEKVIGLALNDNDFFDYEDSLQYFTALQNAMDIIVTRNLKDFQKAKLPVLTADQCMKILQ